MARPRVEYRNPHTVRRPNGEYSHVAILHDSSPVCLIGGQVGVNLEGVVEPSLERQMEQAFLNLGAILEDVGSSFRALLQLTTYLVDAADIGGYFACRETLFPRLFPDGYPTNALIVVSALARPGLLIEIQGIAALPKQGSVSALGIEHQGDRSDVTMVREGKGG